jgi:DivIVA domain-containing protein
MAAVDLDRQAIERKDFPIGRRGYDTAAVDAHLQALAGEFEALQRELSGTAESSLAAAAGSQVQSIIQAAEKAASEIERQALENGRAVREEAERDAERTRQDAIDTARAHVAAVSKVAATLLERVRAMDGEVGALMESLRSGSGRLSGDLGAVESGMADLYDAAAGRSVSGEQESEPPLSPPETAAPDIHVDPDSPSPAPATAPAAPPVPEAPAPAAAGTSAPAPASTDVDGARLVALNMALNGESRADTERYLAENFELPDRDKLVDEVYAAIEG